MNVVRIDDIIEGVATYAKDADPTIIMRAYFYAAKSHLGQTRKSGEPYLIHPLAVAAILVRMRMDVDTIATALLHDTIEDTLVTKQELAELFNPEIAELVDGVTKIGKLQFKSTAEAQAENFRKMVLAMSRDIRVILVKLADRLHNMNTLEHMAPEKQRRIAEETLEIFAPIANRLGLHWIKEELEDLCFRYIHPDSWQALTEAILQSRVPREAYIAQNTALLRDRLTSLGLPCEVSGRAKTLYSIQRKMVQQQLEFDQVYDLLAFRVLVDTLGQCYEALGHVHGLFTPVPEKIKDYIAMPKPNGYRSLHTTVIGPESQRIEIQIRTRDMHNIAEDGICAHWKYKEGHLALKQEDIHRIAQLRELFDYAKDVEDSTDFYDAVKMDLFTHEVFVFTPTREVKVLPSGATALDFAYSIHTEVGHHCIGAKANGRMVPIRYELKSGDTLEILTRPDQKPNRDWLRIARTARALTKIRRALRDDELQRGRDLGKEMLEAELRKHGGNLARLTREGRFREVVRSLEFHDPDALFLALARGHVTAVKVAREMLPDANWEPQEERPEGTFTHLINRIRGRSESPILISGEQDVMFTYAGCCSPLPGEPVMGYITLGHGITIHQSTCPQLLARESERRITVQWDTRVRTQHPASLRVVCVNRVGLLAAISRVCEQDEINISRVDAHPIEDEKSIIQIEVVVHDVQELGRLTNHLERVKGVISASRVRQ